MKKLLFSLFLLTTAASAGAQTIANGYYRVQNQKSGRYAQMVDNHGQASYATSTFDMAAIHTVKPFDTIVDDPATVIYVEYAGTKLDNDFEYNLKAQGTSTWEIVQMNVAMKISGPTYQAWGRVTKAGVTMTAYLMDENYSGKEGIMSHTDNPSNKQGYCNWYVRPLSQDDEHYFGLRPDIAYGGQYYMSFFASFPFDFYSSGMKAYMITKVDGNLAVYREITGTVPASTPVFISCSSTEATSNRLSIVDKATTAPDGNQLKGVYFCNTSAGLHNNVVVNNTSTMRVLGLTKSGQLGFIKSTEQYMPRNRAYLQVPASAPDELVLVSEADYEEVKNKVTITAKSYSRLYGDDNPTFEYTVTDGTILSGAPTLICEATKTSPVGVYPIVVGKGTVSNTQPTFVNGQLTVNKAPLTVTANSYTIKQNEALPTFAATYSGWKNGETETVLTTKPTLTTNAPADKKPGTYTITASGAAATNYSFSYVAGTLTILEADPITVTVKDATMEYGNDVPQFTYEVTGGTLPGTPTLVCAATKTSDVGTYDITVDVSGISYPNIKTVNGKLTITKAPVTVTAKSYTIDETAKQLPDFEATYEGFKNGQDESVLTTKPTFSCGAQQSGIRNGVYNINVTGAQAMNYSFTYVKGTLTINAVPTITVTAEAKQMVYGDDVPELTYTVSGGTLTGQPQLSCPATKTSDVGEYDITVDLGTIDYPQYRLKLQGAKLSVTKAPVVVTAKSYTIDETAQQLPDFEVSYSGFKNGQDESVLTVKPTITCEAQVSALAPGEYPITVAGAEATNYSFTYVNGKLTVNTVPTITVRAEAKQMTYGDEVPELTYVVEGGSLEGQPVLSCTVNSKSDVGEYDITVQQGTIYYPRLELVGAKLTVSKALLKASAGVYTMKQTDERPAFAATYEGFRNDDTEAVITRQPTLTTDAPDDNEPGIYKVYIEGAEALNYDFEYVHGQLIITEADAIVVTVANATKVYGDALPEFTYSVMGGTVEGEPVISCEATESSPVGEYAITVERGTIDYPNLVLVNGVLTVTKAQLAVKADNSEREYGLENPEFVLSYEGFRCGDDESVLTMKPTATTTATVDSSVGEYVIAVEGGEADNYELVRANGVLTVTKAQLTVKADDCQREWGQENPEFTFTFEGFRCGDDENVLLEMPVATTTATVDSPVGAYAIVVEGGKAENYELVLVDGVLTVTMPDAIANVKLTRPVDVYNTTGRKVRSQATDLRGLPKGIYVIEGRKVILK